MDCNYFPALHLTLLCDSMPTSPQGEVTGGPGVANLLDEKVADLLQKHSEPPWGAGLACGPNQTDHMEQRS